MSRCFPFPPPGYEKKARIDDEDLLKKVKHREKKHKKGKDKEKKESREKRDNEGKHKEKKDKKEKRGEKKKDKDKERDKDKSKVNTTDEKGLPGQTQVPYDGQLHQKEIKQNDKKGVSFQDKLTNGEKARENNHHALENNKDSKFLMELDRRIKNNDGGVGSQLVQKFTITDRRNDEGGVRLTAKADGKEKLLDKGIDARKIDGRGTWTQALPIGNTALQNHAGSLQPLEKNFDRTMLEATVEGKKKVKEKKDSDDKRVDKKRKDRDKEKKGHGKDKDRGKKKKKKEDKDRDKEKKKDKKAKDHTEHKNKGQNKLKENNKAGHMDLNSFTQVAARHSHENTFVGENLKKRKDIESSGVLHANDIVPSKLPRPSSSHISTENRRILEHCQISLPNASDKLGAAATNVKVDNMDRKINGVIKALPPAVSSSKTTPAAAAMPADPIAEASSKPPHPDSKYLSQVYSVPKAEEWSGLDDQEWLFSSSCSQERKPATKSSEVEDNKLQVWAEAVYIESADVIALPYVVPY